MFKEFKEFMRFKEFKGFKWFKVQGSRIKVFGTAITTCLETFDKSRNCFAQSYTVVV